MIKIQKLSVIFDYNGIYLGCWEPIHGSTMFLLKLREFISILYYKSLEVLCLDSGIRSPFWNYDLNSIYTLVCQTTFRYE